MKTNSLKRKLFIIIIIIISLSITIFNIKKPLNDNISTKTYADVYAVSSLGVTAYNYPYKTVSYEKLNNILSHSSGTKEIVGKKDKGTYSIKYFNGQQFTYIKIYENGKFIISNNLLDSAPMYLTINEYNSLKKLLGEPVIINSPN